MNRLVAVLSEGRGFGMPIWELAASRGEMIYLYGPRALGEQIREDGESDASYSHYSPDGAWIHARSGEWRSVNLGRWGKCHYARYLPKFKEHFACLCRWALQRGSMIEIVVPLEMKWEAFAALSPVWSTMRPLRYLCQTDICRDLQVPWVYMTGVYNYLPWVGIFVCQSLDTLDELSRCCLGVEDCSIVPLEDALNTEQRNWDDIYRRIEAPTPEELAEQEKQHRGFLSGLDELARRLGAGGAPRSPVARVESDEDAEEVGPIIADHYALMANGTNEEDRTFMLFIKATDGVQYQAPEPLAREALAKVAETWPEPGLLRFMAKANEVVRFL